MAEKITVYIDHFGGEVLPASLEAIGVAKSLAESLGSGVTAVVLGHEVEDLAKQAIKDAENHYGTVDVL